jgi:hypothetical protein
MPDDSEEKNGWGNPYGWDKLEPPPSPPPPEVHRGNPKCKCGWSGERQADGVWHCFLCYERVTGLPWDR